jgi:hypothetical protein
MLLVAAIVAAAKAAKNNTPEAALKRA